MKKWIGLTVIATIGLVALNLADAPIMLRGAVKLIASTGFILTALAGGARSSLYGKCILAGLVLSWWGDAFLIPEDSEAIFQMGLFSFLLGHVTYCIAFVVHGIRVKDALKAFPAVLILSGAMLAWLIRYVPDDMKIPVAAYIIVISSMVILAYGTQGKNGPKHIMIGALMFYFSDIAVSLDRFVQPDFPCYVWGLPLYFVGQLFLASSVAYLDKQHKPLD